MARVQIEAVLKLVSADINSAVFKKISQATAGMSVGASKTADSLDRVGKSSRVAQKGVRGTKAELTGASQAAKIFLQRMAQFAVLLPLFATLNKSIQGGARFLVEFEEQLLNIVRIDIDGLSGRFDELSGRILEISKRFGVLPTAVAESVRVFKQAGDSIEEAFERAEAATLAARVSTLEQAEAQAVAIQISKQFANQVESTATGLDKLVRVEDLAAANAQDLAEAFITGGNAFSEFAKSFDDSVGLIAASVEQTRKSGREIGTFFKTLQARIFAAGESRSAIEGLGVSVQNLDGTLRPTLDVLTDLGASFDNLTEAQRANAAKSIAGVRQFETLFGVLRAVGRANELSAASADANGTALAKLEIQSQGLGFQLNQVVTEFQSLAQAAGDAGLTDVFRSAAVAAKGLAQVVTLIAGSVDGIGGSLAPLLGVAAIGIGKKAFGGGGKDQAATQAATSSLNTFTASVNKASNAASTFSSAPGGLRPGRKLSLDPNQGRKDAIKNGARIAALGIAATFAQQGIDGLALGVKSAGDSLGGFSASVDKSIERSADILGPTAQAGLAFGILGKKAGLAGGSLTAIIQSASVLTKAFSEEIAAIKELANLNIDNERSAAFRESALSGDFDTRVLRQEIVRAVVEGFQDGRSGKEKVGLQKENLTRVAKNSQIDPNQLIDQIFGSDFLEKVLVAASKNNELSGEIGNFAFALEEGRVKVSSAVDTLTKLGSAAGIAAPEINEATGRLQEIAFTDFSQLKKFRSQLVDNFNELRILGEAYDQVLAGPTTTKLQELNVELKKMEGASDSAQAGFDALFNQLSKDSEDFSNLDFSELFGKTREVSSGATQDVSKFLEEIRKFSESRFKFPGEQKIAKELIDATKKVVEARTASANARLSVAKFEEDVAKKRKSILDKSESSLRDAEVKFNSSLSQFGPGITRSTLEAFQDINFDDIQGILKGEIEAPLDLFVLLLSQFGTDIEKAQINLDGTISKFDGELGRLQEKLDDVSSRKAVSELEQSKKLEQELGIQREIAGVKAEKSLEVVRAQISLSEERSKAELKDAKAKMDSIKATEDLTQANFAFRNSVDDSKEALRRFVKDTKSELLGNRDDAAGGLASTQADVIDATAELESSYRDFIGAIIEFNSEFASSRIEVNLLQRDIDIMSGSISSFGGRLDSLTDSFDVALKDSNITLQRRIELERQLASETLTFLQQAQQEIVGAGLGVFGQDAGENAALQQGIAGLNLVAQQLGGSFEAFQGLDGGEINELSSSILNLPVDLRRNILNALQALPSSVSIEGFSVDQLQQAIGQLGAGVDAESGLPSVAELTQQQIAQLEVLQGLSTQSVELQTGQLFAAREQLDLAKEQLDASEIERDRAREELEKVSQEVFKQNEILEGSRKLQIELTDKIVKAEDSQTLRNIQSRAEDFAKQNKEFRQIGNNIVGAISALSNSQRSRITATAIPNGARGFVPNFASGNLTPAEISGLISAAAREKRQMPGGAGLAVANTSEMIIPTRGANTPNFQGGNNSIVAGIESVRGINEAVVAAIASSSQAALSNVGGDDGQDESLNRIADILNQIESTMSDIKVSNDSILSSSQSIATTSDGSSAGITTGSAVSIDLNTNQNSTVSIVGLENLGVQLSEAIRDAALEQIDQQLGPIIDSVNSVLETLRSTGQIDSLGQVI